MRYFCLISNGIPPKNVLRVSQSNDKRREVAADYAAYATDRRHVTTDCALRDSSAVQRSRQEVRLREASRRANAEHFDSWIMVLKVRSAARVSRKAFDRYEKITMVRIARCLHPRCVVYFLSSPVLKRVMHTSAAT